MVKSLLLGGAAGLVAVAGAQAADLPMKAKAPAVQYVKICSLYGAGFYYIPGTDTCLKIGGYIRTQVEGASAGGGIITGSGGTAAQGLHNRVDSNDVQYRNRAIVTFDARTQGEYGTLRSYFVVGWESTTPATTAAGTAAGAAYWDRAFIQFAGFTVGKAQSFFDIYTYGGSRSYLNVRTSGDTGAAGLMLWAYTAQLGGGFSASLSLEDPRGHNLYSVRERTAAAGAYSVGALDNGLASNVGGFGFQVPDIIGNLRYDQAWGFIGVSGALHQVGGGYYGTIAVPPGCGGGGAGCVNAGNPSDKWGYAFGVGAQLNVPGMPGDTTGVGFVWSRGAVGYALSGGVNLGYVDGGKFSTSTGMDAIFAAPGLIPGDNATLHLVDAWSVNAHYEHIWTPTLKSSIYGGYAEVNFPGGAKRVICGGPCGLANPNYGIWLIGSRTQWAPWKGQLNIGVDVVYASYQTAITTFTPAVPVAPGGAQTAKLIGDTDNVLVMFRVQRNWYP